MGCSEDMNISRFALQHITILNITQLKYRKSETHYFHISICNITFSRY